MKCPTCTDSTLLLMEREGVEIDRCAQCKGVWLDRGELDKLIALSVVPPATRSITAVAREEFADSERMRPSGYYAKRKKSWLNDIFD